VQTFHQVRQRREVLLPPPHNELVAVCKQALQSKRAAGAVGTGLRLVAHEITMDNSVVVRHIHTQPCHVVSTIFLDTRQTRVHKHHKLGRGEIRNVASLRHLHCALHKAVLQQLDIRSSRQRNNLLHQRLGARVAIAIRPSIQRTTLLLRLGRRTGGHGGEVMQNAAAGAPHTNPVFS
jgi:hypothetical protein